MRIVLGLALIGLVAAPVAYAGAPPVHPVAPFAHPAVQPFHVTGAGVIGGPAKQQPGIVIGEPILKHH